MSQNRHFPSTGSFMEYAGTAQGEGLGGFSPPPTFVLYTIKIKESSNQIEEENLLVRNGLKFQFNISKRRRRHKE